MNPEDLFHYNTITKSNTRSRKKRLKEILYRQKLPRGLYHGFKEESMRKSSPKN
jgi:hypothetical protein